MHEGKGELKIGILLNYVNLALSSLIPLFYTPIMLRLLGQEEYGLYKLSGSITSYLGLISLGLGSAVTRYLIKARTEVGQKEEERMLGLFLIIFRFIAIISFVVGTILTANLDLFYSNSLNEDEMHRIQILVFIMVCNMALSFSVAPYMSIVTARERYLFYQCMNILITCVIPFLNLIALFLGFASIGLAITSLCVAIVVRLIYYIYVRAGLHIKPQYKNIPTEYLREILMFSFWIFVGNVVGQLYDATDTILIGSIPTLATTGVAIYSVGTIFNNMIITLTAGISNLLVPRTNKLVFEGKGDEVLTEYSILIGRIQCYICSTIVAVFVVFGKPIIHFYVGDIYQEAYWVAVFIMVPNLIPLAQSACLSIVIAKNQHKFRSLIYLGIAIINVFGTWFALHHWGVSGAAFVTGIAMLVGQGACMNWYYGKKTGINIALFWKHVLIVFIVPVFFSTFCIFVFKLGHFNLYRIEVLIISIALFFCFIFLLQWHFFFNPYEKSLILTPLKKTINIIKS